MVKKINETKTWPWTFLIISTNVHCHFFSPLFFVIFIVNKSNLALHLKSIVTFFSLQAFFSIHFVHFCWPNAARQRKPYAKSSNSLYNFAHLSYCASPTELTSMFTGRDVKWLRGTHRVKWQQIWKGCRLSRLKILHTEFRLWRYMMEALVSWLIRR